MADFYDRKRDLDKSRAEFESREAERLKNAKIKRNKRKKQRKIFTVIFLILLLLSAVLIFIRTPLFKIKNVEVSGNNLVLKEEIIQKSGLEVGDNIFDRTSSYSEKRIIKMPYISSVEVKKKYPSTVLINVLEEGVYGAILTEGKIIGFDKNGKSIKELSEEETEGIVIIKGVGKTNFPLGEYVSFKDEKKLEIFNRCLFFIKDYSLENVRILDIEDEKNVIMYIGEGLKVKLGTLGTEDELSYKMAYIKEVINNLPQNVSGVIDATNVESGVSYRTEEYTEEEKAEEEDTENDSANIEKKEEENEENT